MSTEGGSRASTIWRKESFWNEKVTQMGKEL